MKALCILIALIALMTNAIALAVIQEGVSKTVVIVEQHGISGDSVSARVVGGLDRQEIRPPTLGAVGHAVGGPYPDAPSAVSAVQSAVSGQIGGYADAVAQYLQKYGYAAASTHWYLSFNNLTTGGMQQVYANIMVGADGSVNNSGFAVATQTQTILYCQYISLSAEAGLPTGPGWAYPHAGELTVEVKDMAGNVLSQTTTQTNGAYDSPPTAYDGSTTDPDAGLKLLISNVIVPGIVNNGAVMAIVDYVRAIAPVYNCDQNGNNCTPVTSVDYQVRTLTPVDPCSPDGAATYENSGVYGYMLHYTIDRYMVTNTGSYTPASETQTTQPSPGVVFDFATQVPTGSAAAMAFIGIDPHGTGQTYDYRNDTVNNIPCANYIDGGQACNAAAVSVVVVQCVPPPPQPPTGDQGGG